VAAKKGGSRRPGRERILAAAIRQFAELGFDVATTVSIAREARVTQPDVHHHFGSKLALWKAAMDELFKSIAPFRPVEPVADTREAMLRAGLESFVRVIAEQPALARVIAREGSTPGERLAYLVEHHIGPVLHGAVAVIRHAQAEGWIKSEHPPELLLFLSLGAADHIFLIRPLVKRVFNLDIATEKVRDEFVAVYVETILRGLARG
jgi:AcrR family transcriptional regulator